jgi:outer membrane protein OmpA-like peptidoglycan-associated protein
MDMKNLTLFLTLLTLPTLAVVAGERSAAGRMAELGAAASDVPIASAAEEGYCTPQLKAIVRRVATSCGLVEGGRGCKPADARSVATMTGEDFNALFTPLAKRAHIVQFDAEQTELDDPARKEVEEVWTEKGGASFFFVVARASPDGDAKLNTQLSQQRAQAVMGHLEQKFPGDEDIKKVGLLWLGEDFAQLDTAFCDWNRSRKESTAACTAKDINRSAFVAWIDCAI